MIDVLLSPEQARYLEGVRLKTHHQARRSSARAHSLAAKRALHKMNAQSTPATDVVLTGEPLKIAIDLMFNQAMKLASANGSSFSYAVKDLLSGIRRLNAALQTQAD